MNTFLYLADMVIKETKDPNGALAVSALAAFFILSLIFILAIAVLVFWVISLIHLIQHEDVKDRVLWIVLLFVFGGIIGPIYYFAIKKPYDKQRLSADKKNK